MPCTDAWPAALAGLLAALCLLGSAAAQTDAVAAAVPSASTRVTAAPKGPATSSVRLAPPERPADWEALQLQMAERLVAAHPDTSYTTPSPDRLLAIPVLEVELNANGSVRNIRVLRRPTTGAEGAEATRRAMAAIRKAAPYGEVSHLKRPWRVVETFLFDDELRFKPRTLD